MCLHAAFDLLFVGLSTGIVASIDLLVSGTGIRARARGWVGAWVGVHGCKTDLNKFHYDGWHVVDLQDRRDKFIVYLIFLTIDMCSVIVWGLRPFYGPTLWLFLLF